MNIVRSFLYEKILYPLYQIKLGPGFGIKTNKILKQLDKSQWSSQEEIVEYQNRKLRKLVHHIYQNVPYYYDIMQEINLRPEDIRSVKDLKYFPVLTKKEIKNNFTRILSKDIKKRNVMKASTGGTTGEPLLFYRDFNSRVWTEAALLRGWSWSKYKLGDATIKISNDDWPSMLGKIRSKLINYHCFPAFVKKDTIISYFKEIELLNPYCISGLSSNLYRIANLYKKSNVNGIEFPVIFTTAEMLYDYQRDFLEKQFNGKVFDHYGSNEISSLAYECEYNKKHITNEHVIIETIDSSNNSITEKESDIVITDLDNYSMPFLRYKIGDIGTLTDNRCECGRGLSVLKSVNGRSQDFLKTLDGNHVPAVYFPIHFNKLTGIEQYQIIQTDIHHILLKIVKNRMFSSEELEKMLRVVRKMIGEAVNIKVEECSHIALTGRGKTRLVISHVPTEF